MDQGAPHILTLLLAMVFVMISQTTLNVTMMVEIAVVQMPITVLISAMNVNVVMLKDAMQQIQQMEVCKIYINLISNINYHGCLT
jgi:hypothetical protein